jgi:GH15 family glucan-1,4-alpha-glucosidase
VEAPDVVRIVEGKRGEVPMRLELTIRFDYGSIVPWVRRTETGLQATAGPDTLLLHTPVALRGENMHTVADFPVKAGQHVPFLLTWMHTYANKPREKDPAQSLTDTEAWWRDWSGKCTYQGEWRDAVLRSLITLKALTYMPTGGVVAAATTSLPEKLGGVRNWDYRFCWLRDATFTLYALMTGGYMDEAKAWREWLINSVAGSPAELQIMYGLAGERRLTELELDWLPGYEDSKPVRIGNLAFKQFQLDVYGEIMDALHLGRRSGLEPSDNAWRIQRAIMNFLEEGWRKPDEGIWEVRGPRRHFTHSKVMAWVALDRAVKAVDCFGRTGPVEKWKKLRQEIHTEVCAEGFNSNVNSFVQYYGSRCADASLLMMPVVGFLPPTDPRIIGTVDYIQRELMHDGFVHRYPARESIDGLPPGEGVFLLCTFWLVDNLALLGRYQEARDIFERLLGLRNDVGLLSEQFDPATQRLIGNFPQAFSHVGLINSARNLSRAGGPAEDRQDGSRKMTSDAECS